MRKKESVELVVGGEGEIERTGEEDEVMNERSDL